MELCESYPHQRMDGMGPAALSLENGTKQFETIHNIFNSVYRARQWVHEDIQIYA